MNTNDYETVRGLSVFCWNTDGDQPAREGASNQVTFTSFKIQSIFVDKIIYKTLYSIFVV